MQYQRAGFMKSLDPVPPRHREEKEIRDSPIKIHLSDPSGMFPCVDIMHANARVTSIRLPALPWCDVATEVEFTIAFEAIISLKGPVCKI